MDNVALRAVIVEKALKIGFDKVGFAPVLIETEGAHLKSWLAEEFHGDMSWMKKNADRRSDATKNLSSAKTVVCCALNYYQGPPAPPSKLRGVISSYAWGEDYHRILETKLKELSSFIEKCANVTTRYYVDTGPMLEKSYAASAGLGWVGKHSNLLSRDGSSWFFLGEILVPIELPIDDEVKDHCGTCNRCIEICPTKAIVKPYVVDSRLCISYLTIELRKAIPRKLRPLIGNRIYGCDDCQDVCPWNKFARKSEEEVFFPREPLCSMDLIEMLEMSLEDFLDATKKSAIRRARYAGFLRNVAVALGNSRDTQALPALIRALEHKEPLVRSHAAWAIGYIGEVSARPALLCRIDQEINVDVQEELSWALNALALATGDHDREL